MALALCVVGGSLDDGLGVGFAGSMNAFFLILTSVSAAILVSGCDTVSGVTRDSKLHVLPNLTAVNARIESYPEVKEV
jgi:predicted small secreted protein